MWCGLSISYPVPERRNRETLSPKQFCGAGFLFRILSPKPRNLSPKPKPRNRGLSISYPVPETCPRNPKPIFSGLAWALIFGLAVSTAFTLILIPVVYWMVYRNRPGHGVAIEAEDE